MVSVYLIFNCNGFREFEPLHIIFFIVLKLSLYLSKEKKNPANPFKCLLMFICSVLMVSMLGCVSIVYCNELLYGMSDTISIRKNSRFYKKKKVSISIGITN